MRVLITGASGFLGRAVVRAAAAAGHEVVALVRPTADISNLGWPDHVGILRGDLRQRQQWCSGLSDIEAVVHLAAAVEGDLAAQFSGTVAATENLLDCLPMSSVRRFVHISTFSVYDFGAVRVGGKVTERTPLEPQPEARDPYTITKMAQEKLVVETCRDAAVHHVVIRPGAIFGPGKDWNFGRAMKLGPFDLLFAPRALFKATYVANCVAAIVKAIDAPVASGAIFNVVDDELPSHARYHRLCRLSGAATGRAVHIPWFVVAGIGRGIGLFNRVAFGGRAKLPALLSYRRQQAAWKPLRYCNKAAKEALGWSPHVGLAQAIDRTVRRVEGLASSTDPHEEHSYERPHRSSGHPSL